MCVTAAVDANFSSIKTYSRVDEQTATWWILQIYVQRHSFKVREVTPIKY
jgi:hypothetical protein